jgi:uncharacterized protein (TIGR02452 family)
VRPDPALVDVFRARCVKVLQLAALHRHATRVLGAWGCGAFHNDPHVAADAFARALEQTRGAFERVVFAIWERSPNGPNLEAFSERLGILAK